MKYLGIDYGTKKIGIALSDDTGSVAFPLTSLKTGERTLGEIIELINKHEVEALVLGESKDLKGKPNPVMGDIEKFKDEVSGLSQLPVHYEAEFFTSALAARQFAPEAKSRKEAPSQERLDAAAAALILQSFLDRTKNKE